MGLVTVGLTGGIASGKSFVASYLEKYGFPIIDADRIAHKIQEPHTPAYEEIVQSFGTDILNMDGTINRQALGAAVFGNEEKLALLAGITHPRIYEEQARQLLTIAETRPDAVVIMEVALLIESGAWHMMDFVMVTYCEPAQQIARLMDRNNFDEATATLRVQSQWPLLSKVAYADFLVDTSGDIDWTVRQLDRLAPQLMSLSEEEPEDE